MNKSLAYQKLSELVSNYKSKFETIGVHSEYEIYFLDAKNFKEVSSDEDADSLCASVTLISSSDKDIVCGFDITADIRSGGEINEEDLNSSIAKFTEETDAFLAKIALSENRDDLIREAAECEKALFQAKVDSFNSTVKNLQTKTVIMATVAIIVIFIAVFAFISK